MIEKNYQGLALRTEPDSEQYTELTFSIIDELSKDESDRWLRILHGTLGVNGEVGELCEALFNGEVFAQQDSTLIMEEIGDAFWYIAILSDTFGDSFEDMTHSAQIGELPSHLCVLQAVKLSGMLTDFVKKSTFYQKSFPQTDFIKTCYDLVSVLMTILDRYDIPLSRCLDRNIEKLRTRYPDKYTADQAINRDVTAERRTLESN